MAKFKLQRKTFGLGAIASGAMKSLKPAAKIGAGVVGVGAVGAGVLANKAGGGDLLSGGEKSAKEMDFS